jgi:hypothetical protein
MMGATFQVDNYRPALFVLATGGASVIAAVRTPAARLVSRWWWWRRRLPDQRRRELAHQPHEHPNAGQQIDDCEHLADRRAWDEIAVTDRRERHHAEVQRIKQGTGGTSWSRGGGIKRRPSRAAASCAKAGPPSRGSAAPTNAPAPAPPRAKGCRAWNTARVGSATSGPKTPTRPPANASAPGSASSHWGTPKASGRPAGRSGSSLVRGGIGGRRRSIAGNARRFQVWNEVTGLQMAA